MTETEPETETDRQTDRQRQRETDRQTDKVRDRDRETQTHRESDRNSEKTGKGRPTMPHWHICLYGALTGTGGGSGEHAALTGVSCNQTGVK